MSGCLPGIFSYMLGPRSEPRYNEVDLGPITIRVDAREELLPIYNINDNLQLAEQNDIKPVSLRTIMEEVKGVDPSIAVLFDTPPVRGFPGNHWRIIEINPETKSATLQHCNSFGNYDHKQVLHVEVPLGSTMFTGFSIQRFLQHGHPVPLGDVTEMTIQESQELQYGEEIYWSNKKGILT